MRNVIIYFLFTLFASTLSAQTPRLIAPIGHTKGVEAVAFSPNGKYVLTGSTDNTAKLWDLKGHEIQNYTDHTGEVTSVAFSPACPDDPVGGKLVLTGSTDGTVKLWSLNGEVVQTISGHDTYIESVAFSPDGKQVLTGGRDNKAKLWSLDGREIQTFKGHKKDINSVAFSPDGKQILTSSKDSTAKIWNLNGEVVQTFTGHGGKVKSAVFSPDGKQVLTSSDDKTAKLWSLDGHVVQTFTGHKDQVNMAVFSPDGKFVLTGSHDLKVKLWDLNGREIRTYDGRFATTPSRVTLAFSPNGKLILTGSKGGTAKLWTLYGRNIQTYKGHAERIRSVAFSTADAGKYILIGSEDGTARVWDVTDRDVHLLKGHTNGIKSVAFSPIDGVSLMLTGSKDANIRLWDKNGREHKKIIAPYGVNEVVFSPDGKQILAGAGTEAKRYNLNGDEIRTFTDYETTINAVVFSPVDGKQVLSGEGMEAKLRDFDGQEIRTYKGHSKWVTSVAFSPDGKLILTGSDDKTAKLWSLDGTLLQTFAGHGSGISSVAFSPGDGGKRILTSSYDNTAKLWDMNGRLLHTFTGHTHEIYSATFSPDGKFVLTGSFDNTAKIWDAASGDEKATLMAVDDSDWVVTTPSGLFDASSGAMNLMHFVVGLEVIELEQLKERYFEPGLLAKVLGLSKDTYRNVESFKDVALYPEMSAQLSADNSRLEVTMIPRNGGIGKLSVFINGKEVKEDANASRSAACSLDISEFARYCLPDTINQLALRVFNSDGWLKSPALEIDFTPPAPKAPPTSRNKGMLLRKKPSLYAVIIGTSKYANDKLTLQFADHDASSFSQALRAAAAKVFDDRVYVTLLNTDDRDSTRQALSSKTNIRQVFEDIAAKAQSQDVLVIYCSGHGVSYGEAEKSQFYYLTKDITSENLSMPEIRKNFAISSTEITEWVKSVPALKQVLIIDACHSGKLVEDVAAGRKDLSSSQIHALDRMKDRTGMFILTGSAADKVSYEASEYGQGLLTYSILQGMKILGSTDDHRIDVMSLFQYSRDKVPELAKGIGGIQTPVLASPPGGSFDIGIVDKDVKIPIAEKKPVFSRSVFQEEASFYDVLELTPALAERFRRMTARGAQADLIYVDVPKYENAYSINGLYTISGDDVVVRGSLIKDKASKGTFQVTGKKDDVPALVDQIIEEVSTKIKNN